MDKASRRCKVLAVSGPSGTGKTTLADGLHRRLSANGMNVKVIHQDSYFIGEKPKSYWTQAPKESPDTVDMPALRAAVAEASDDEEHDLFILEGFLLLQDAALMELTDAVLFLTGDQQTCLARRLARSVRSEHEMEGLRIYYGKHVWPGYLKYTEPALRALRAGGPAGTPLLVELDGTRPRSIDQVTEEGCIALPALLGERFRIAGESRE